MERNSPKRSHKCESRREKVIKQREVRKKERKKEVKKGMWVLVPFYSNFKLVPWVDKVVFF